MKLKSVKKMNHAMQRAFSITGASLSMQLDSDFYYLPEKQKIKYTLLAKPTDRTFKSFLKKYLHFTITSDIELFCVSVLHEIGHYYTQNKIAEGDYLYSKDEERKIAVILKNHPHDDEAYRRYFLLPVEIIATVWAINFIESHPKKYKKLIKKVQKIFKKHLMGGGEKYG